MIGDFFGTRSAGNPKQVCAIKEWAAEVFRLDADATVMVVELRCTEPGCPPMETVIAILDTPGKPVQHKIHKPLAEVSFADVLGLVHLDQDAECTSHGHDD